MSDAPVPPPMQPPTPPPPPSTTSPVPPPPMMAPPPGYTAYAPTNWGGGLSRVKPLSTWILALLVVVAIGNLVGLVTANRIIDASEKYLATLDADEFDTALGLNSLGGLIAGVPTIAIIVLSIIWLYRIARNHLALGRQVRWAPGWAIGGWFLPPCLYVIPTLMLQESWKASDPDTPAGSDSWRSVSSSALIWVWFVGYSVVGLIGGAASSVPMLFNTSRRDQAEFFADRGALLYAQSLIAIVGCVLWFLVVRQLTERHTRLTGEASAR